MSFFERMVLSTLPIMPRSLVAKVASRYVAGELLMDALKTVRSFNESGALATIDLLGEEYSEADTADETVNTYIRALDTIHADKLDTNISIKLTAYGLHHDEEATFVRVRRIVEHAHSLANFVRIDMEDHLCTDATFRIYRRLREEFDNVGIVLQAMLKRTADDVEALSELKPNIRLCKGIYREPETIAFKTRDEINESYLSLMNRIFDIGSYLALATHDDYLIQQAQIAVNDRQLDVRDYEFQMLLGVLPLLREHLIATGARLRVYVPFGQDWYAYSMRRLRENPTIARHVLKAMVTKG